MLSKAIKRLGAALTLSCCFLGTVSNASAAAAPKANQNQNGAAASELIVKFKPGATDVEIQHGLKQGKLKVKKHLQTNSMKKRGQNGLTLVESELPAEQAIELLTNHQAIVFVEPNHRYKHQLASNDTYVNANYTWGLYSALSSPANTFGSGAMDAWT